MLLDWQTSMSDAQRLNLTICRQGVVVTLVEKSEQFVIEKLSRGLGVTIPELQMREGMIAPVESSDWEEQGISKASKAMIRYVIQWNVTCIYCYTNVRPSEN